MDIVQAFEKAYESHEKTLKSSMPAPKRGKPKYATESQKVNVAKAAEPQIVSSTESEYPSAHPSTTAKTSTLHPKVETSDEAVDNETFVVSNKEAENAEAEAEKAEAERQAQLRHGLRLRLRGKHS